MVSETLANNNKVLFSSLAEEQIVHAVEEIDECSWIVFEFEVRLVQNFLGQHLGDVVCDLWSAVTVEHSEEMHSFCDLLADDSILHGLAPA